VPLHSFPPELRQEVEGHRAGGRRPTFRLAEKAIATRSVPEIWKTLLHGSIFSRESTRHADAGCRLLNRACNSSPLRVVHIVPPSAPTQTTALSNARAGLCSLHRFKDRLFCDFDRFLRVIGRILRISERNKMIENMVARDGVEPPTPAFSAWRPT